MSETPHVDALARTESALASGLTGITPTTALGLIDHWQAACADAGLTEISSSLAHLGGLLRADRLDGRAIGASLRGLSTATVDSASGDGALAGRLQALGAALDRGASMLGA